MNRHNEQNIWSKSVNYLNSMDKAQLLFAWTSTGHLFSHPMSTAFNRYQVSKINAYSFSSLTSVIFGKNTPITFTGKMQSLYLGFFAAGVHKILSRFFKYIMLPGTAKFVSDAKIIDATNPAVFVGIAGAIIGVLEVPLMHPIETIKLKRQSGNNSPLLHLIRNERFGLYKGATLAACKNFLGLSIFFGMTEYTKQKLSDGNRKQITFEILFISAMAGAIAETLLTNPLDVIKKRTQLGAGNLSAFSVFKEAVKNEGARVLYRGSILKMCRAVTKKALPMAVMQLAFSGK